MIPNLKRESFSSGKYSCKLAAQIHPIPHLATEAAEVLGMLADLNLLDLLTKTGTIPGTVLPYNPHLLRPLRLYNTNNRETSEK